MSEVVRIVIFSILAVFMAILAIGAAVINLFDREKERNERQIQKTDKKSYEQ